MNAPIHKIEFALRDFEGLLQDAKALQPDDTTEMADIVSECKSLSAIERRQVFDAIKKATGLPLSVLSEQLRAEQGPEPDHLDLARQVIDLKGAENIICAEGHVWGWEERGVWASLDEREVKQDVQSALADMPAIDVTSATVNAVTEVLKNDIYKKGHAFNCGNPEAVNCLNGQIELVGGDWRLKPHCREEYRTTQIPVAFDPKATAPRFEAFLDQIFVRDDDKADKRQALMELVGYTLMSHARHEKFVMLIGAGANGKSVLLTILTQLCGLENVAGVQPSSFDNQFQRAHLHQKLANIVTELGQGEVIADAQLKGITSGEPATVEHKHKDPFVMQPFSTCWFGTNHMPSTRDFSDALFRRAVILTFTRVFEPHEQNPRLKDELVEELPGILNLALNAYSEALEFGFTEPASSLVSKNEWRLEADQVAMFVEEACQRASHAQTPISEVYTAYTTWATASGIKKTVAMKTLRDRLTRLGFGNNRDMHTRYVTGLQMLSP